VDGGLNFKKLDLKLEKSSSIIHSVLSFPEQGAKGKILVLHGDENSVGVFKKMRQCSCIKFPFVEQRK